MIRWKSGVMKKVIKLKFKKTPCCPNNIFSILKAYIAILEWNRLTVEAKFKQIARFESLELRSIKGCWQISKDETVGGKVKFYFLGRRRNWWKLFLGWILQNWTINFFVQCLMHSDRLLLLLCSTSSQVFERHNGIQSYLVALLETTQT